MSSLLNPIRLIRKRWKTFWRVNWLKTYYFNYKMFPKEVARKLPVYIYGPIKLTNLTGTIILPTEVHKKMIRFGFNYEQQTVSRTPIELSINGSLEFEGMAQIGKDSFIYVAKDAHCTLGNMVGIASRTQLMCEESITIGEWTRISADCQIYDTNFHSFVDTETGNKYPKTGPIKIGSHNFIGYRTSIKKNSITPDYCTVASNSLCSKDYTALGSNTLVGGIPAVLLKSQFSRDWEYEKQRLLRTFST